MDCQSIIITSSYHNVCCCGRCWANPLTQTHEHIRTRVAPVAVACCVPCICKRDVLGCLSLFSIQYSWRDDGANIGAYVRVCTVTRFDIPVNFLLSFQQQIFALAYAVHVDLGGQMNAGIIFSIDRRKSINNENLNKLMISVIFVYFSFNSI